MAGAHTGTNGKAPSPRPRDRRAPADKPPLGGRDTSARVSSPPPATHLSPLRPHGWRGGRLCRYHASALPPSPRSRTRPPPRQARPTGAIPRHPSPLAPPHPSRPPTPAVPPLCNVPAWVRLLCERQKHHTPVDQVVKRKRRPRANRHKLVWRHRHATPPPPATTASSPPRLGRRGSASEGTQQLLGVPVVAGQLVGVRISGVGHTRCQGEAVGEAADQRHLGHGASGWGVGGRERKKQAGGERRGGMRGKEARERSERAEEARRGRGGRREDKMKWIK